VEFKLSVRVPPQLIFATDVDAMPISMTMEREGMPSKPCLGCCVCAPGCKDGMYLHAGPVGEAAGPGSRNCVGFATQPSWGGGFVPTLNVMERANGGANAANVWNALAKVEGPTCFGGCSELCFSSKFGVSKFSAGQVDAAVKSADLATIVKRKPHDLAGAMREAATDADLYTLQLNPAANLAPQQKAILLASLVLSDYMFFECAHPPPASRSPAARRPRRVRSRDRVDVPWPRGRMAAWLLRVAGSDACGGTWTRVAADATDRRATATGAPCATSTAAAACAHVPSIAHRITAGHREAAAASTPTSRARTAQRAGEQQQQEEQEESSARAELRSPRLLPTKQRGRFVQTGGSARCIVLLVAACTGGLLAAWLVPRMGRRGHTYSAQLYRGDAA
jgi:hypothetical protein